MDMPWDPANLAGPHPKALYHPLLRPESPVWTHCDTRRLINF